jgi:hypothetical protein
MTPRWPLAALGAVLLALALAACTSDPEGNDMTPPTPPILPIAQAEQQVRGYADRLVDAMGNLELRTSAEDTLACEDKPDDWYYISGTYQVLVPAERQGAALTAVKEYALGEGYTLKNEQSLPDGTGDVTVVNPRDGHTITVASGKPPAMALLINSPCYRSQERLRTPSSTPSP